MEVGTSSLVAVVSAGIALLSAVYARWQVRAVERQNQLSLHADRLSVYREVAHYYAVSTRKGARVAEEDVWKYREAVATAEFYFPGDVHSRLSQVFDKSIQMLAKNDDWEGERASGNAKATELNRERHQLAGEIRDELSYAMDRMKEKLRVGDT